MQQIKVEDFSLEHTMESGQFFCFQRELDTYYIAHANSPFKIRQINDELHYEGIDESKLIEFFNLNDNLKEQFSKIEDEYVRLAMQEFWGMRIINADLWQTIIGFVCSSAANIPKIKMNLNLLSEYFGEEVEIDGVIFYTFPKPGSINDIDKIISAKTGYRAKYIQKINEMILENPSILNEIEEADYKKAKELLMQFPGVGSKVADCICLFSLGHNEAFPVDTWVKQAVEKYYLKKSSSIKEVEEFINNYFKDNRGIKQQYLFQYIRTRD